MNRSPVTADIALDRLAKVGAEEAKLNAEAAIDIGHAAAALRRNGQGFEPDTNDPTVVVTLDAVRPDQSPPKAGPWVRIGAVAAAVVVSIIALGALSQREQVVSTEPADGPGTAESSVVDVAVEEIPSSTLVVESGPTTANIAADTVNLDETIEPDKTSEPDEVGPSTTTVPEETAVSSAPAESTTSTADSGDEGSAGNFGDGFVRLTVGEAGTVDLKLVDNVASTTVDAVEGWNHTLESVPGGDGQELMFTSPDNISAWLTIRSTTSQFNLAIDQLGGSVYRYDRRQSRVFDIGQAGQATLQHDVTGLVGLDVAANEGWTLSTSTTSFNEIRLHLSGPANGYRTSTEIRVGDLLILITSSDP